MTRSLCFSRPIAALLLLGAMVFGTSTAFSQKADGLNASLSVSPAFEDGTSRASLGGQNLVVDDGGPEDSIGLASGGTFVWLNRFTPPAGDFPMQLQSADILFSTAGGFPAGSTFDVFVWSDADGDPGNGATLVGSATGNTVGVLDVFQTVTFSSPIAIATVGDVLIGARVTATAGHFPAAIDQTSPQVRSWAGFGAGADTTPPTIPTATFGTIDSFGLPGNWLIRGTYTTGGVATESGPYGVSRLEVSPNPATTQGQVVLSVATSQAVRVALYDALGREVRVLLERSLVAGQEAHIGFRTADLPAGVYVIRATGTDVSLVERITVVR